MGKEHDIKLLMYFIFGILFVEVFIPIVDGLINLILSKFEVFKGQYSLKLSKINVDIQKLTDDDSKRRIGFMASNDCKEEYDE